MSISLKDNLITASVIEVKVKGRMYQVTKEQFLSMCKRGAIDQNTINKYCKQTKTKRNEKQTDSNKDS